MAILAGLLRRRGALYLLGSSTRLLSPLATASSSFSSAADGHPALAHVPVLIVGAGPVGLVLAFLLTKFGLKCTVIEKSLSFSQHPQAHFINNRSMEIFRKLDGLAGEIEEMQAPVDLWRKFIYCSSLSGSIFGSVDHMQPQDFDKVISPVSVGHFSQYKLVNTLLEKLEKNGFHISYPDDSDLSTHGTTWQQKILMGHECTSLQLDADGMMVRTSLIHNGKLKEKEFHCNFLIGADGARSTVRKLVGISMEGEKELQKLVSMHFLSRDLGQFLLKCRPGMLYFIFNSEAIGVLVAHDLMQGEFVLQVPYYPPQQSMEDFSPKVCEQLICKLAGRELADVRVLDIKPWVMHAEVAEKYLACNDRVILVGDAAHRFPPAGGFGMNTGIQDAHNLAWKLYYSMKHIASQFLIRSYETERRPIAIFNTNLSVNNFKAAMAVPAAIGLDPTVANSVHQAINSRFGSILPKSFQKVIFEGLFSIGRAQASDYILNEGNPFGLSRLKKLNSILDEGKSLQLQFPAEDLGFCYQEGALVTKSSKDTQTGKSGASVRASRQYVPSVDPGCRLPHMLVRALPTPPDKGTLSTLDLVSGCSPEFLLLMAPVKESYCLARTVCDVAEKFRVTVKVCVMWPQGTSRAYSNSDRIDLDSTENYINVEEASATPGKSWWEMCKMNKHGVILVRPDEHIAWRTESCHIGDAVLEVRKVFSQILGVDPPV